MKKFVGALVLVVALLAPAQVVMAEFHDHLPPWWEQAMNTQMMLEKVMMKSMHKKTMTPAQEKKLMRMLKELDDLLTEAGGS